MGRSGSGAESVGSHQPEMQMKQAVRHYLAALEAGDEDKAAALFIPDGWVDSPFLGRLPVREFIRKVAGASSGAHLTVHDVLVSAEGHLRAVAYYQYDWRLKDGSRVSFDCADVFNFDPVSGRIQSIVLVYDTQPVRDVVANKYP
jgi:ketosteroid isomerase-like protein